MVKAKKFGAISGVFTPSILTILGVILYLRLPWIVGQAGLWATVGIILVAHIISFATGLSVASIATDKKVETGGSYYIISRSLGLPIGGTLGLALFAGLSFSVSLYLIGFAEVFLGYFGFETTINNIRLAGAIALLALTILTFISTSLAIKAQYIILTALLLSLVSIFFGKGGSAPTAPLFSSMSGSLPWITLFAIFFPAVTGFEAGVSMSGDLKNPKKNIPTGTIAAVLVGLGVYLGLAFFFSYFVERDMLVNDSSVLFTISWIPQLVVAGILGATLSSALGSILGAPRILQATANDQITPSILGKGFGASNEPRNALLFTFIIALSGILIGELNVIARIVTIFFIITYGFLNITYAIESWAGTDFRPSFRIHWMISIIGAITCIVVMIQLDIVAMIGASIILFGLFLFLKKKELTLQTGDTWNSVWASLVKTGLGKLTSGNKQPRNWRPNVILFSGGAKNRPYLIEMAKSVVGKLGIFTNFELVENKDEKTLFSKSQQVIEEESSLRKGVFTRKHECRDIYEGMESIAKVYGFSGFEPNTILMGWPRNTRNPESFTRLIRKLKKLDYNQVYLNYDKTFEFGKKKQIDVWWSGKGRNISLAITLLRFMTSSHEWRTANIRIMVINNHSNHSEKYYELLDQILENARMKAEIKVINNSVEKLPTVQIFRSESINTDFSIIELEDTNENLFNLTCQLTENLPSSMVISASSFFDDHSIVDRSSDDRLVVTEQSAKPQFSVTAGLKLAKRELIANEVYKAAQSLETLTAEYYKNGFESILNKSIAYFDELLRITEKSTEQLLRAAQPNDSQDVKTEFLKAINDFSYRAQNTLKNYKKEVVESQKKMLQSSTNKYFAEIQNHLNTLPQHIRIKYNWKEFRLLKADSFMTSVFKGWKLFKARITGRQATYNVKVYRAARYYLFHKRLELANQMMTDYALHSFENIIAIRKILQDIYELAEKGKLAKPDLGKLKNIIHMEKDRLRIAVELQSETSRNFIYNLGLTLESELTNDLQNFNNLLERPGSNFLSKPFVKAIRKNETMLENITGYSDTWLSNSNLFINKIYVDFLIQSIKNRIESKLKKYCSEYRGILNSGLLLPIDDLKQKLSKYVEKNTFDKKPDRTNFKAPHPDDHFNSLYEEISSLFNDLPLTISISGDDLSKALEERRFAEAQEIVINIRKTVEFSIASELIDHIKKQSFETSRALNKSLSRVKDYVRLINFNLADDPDNEPQTIEEKRALTLDFIEKLEMEYAQVLSVFTQFESSFASSLKSTFAPLSSSVIAKTSGSIQKKIVSSRNQKLIDQWQQWQKTALQSMQNQIVNLIYSKSAGVLWVGKMEKPANQTEINNEEVFAWLDKYAPKREIINQLPFYYAKLFSGQSGIGDDFWVGMQEEITKASNVIKRFQSGLAGCLIISGERNSGKTSLSKYIARRYFPSDAVFNIRSPRECTADVDLWEESLLKSLNSTHQGIESAMADLSKPVVFIINDLELWWERRNMGTDVVERLMQLIRKYHSKALFIININSHSLKLINKLTGLQSWSLGTISCSGFDAKELHDLIMLRHQAGGMSFKYGNKEEEEMSSWNYARLFNRYFDICEGNPGLSIALWLASIEKVNGKSITIKKPPTDKADFLEKLSKDQIFVLLQFIYHLRMSVRKLAQTLQAEEGELENQILNLWQSGILIEKFPGIYAINPTIQLPLVKKLQTMKLL
jgi:amino acid transporter